tara:strand:+ start:202 stop:492 length:291 start_codon:yes stop_codon:yes gene_type:complete
MSNSQGLVPDEVVLADDDTQKLVQVLRSQHALMGIYGNVFERLGGEQFLYEWAEDNPSKYLTQLVKMVPTLAPTAGLQGEINIRISADLPRSVLDD